MSRTLAIDFGWCGIGWDDADPAGLCLGIIRLAWIRGGLVAKLRDMQAALAAARDAVRGPKATPVEDTAA